MKNNRYNFWNDELKKYGELSKNSGNIKDSISPALTTPGSSKTKSNNPLDIYKDYIKGVNKPSTPDLTNKLQPSVSPTNPLDKDKDLSTADTSGMIKPDWDIIGKGGATGGKKNEGGLTNPTLEKYPTIYDDLNYGAIGNNDTSSLPSSPKTDLVTPTNPSKSNADLSSNVPNPPKTTTPSATNSANETIETAPSNKFSAKYQGTDFLEWYKANYGQDYDPSTILSRKEGMSDVDWDIGNSLYDTYRKDQQRKSDYESRLSSLDKSKMQSQQNASIIFDKLKKYLPMQIKAQGLSGLGVSESSLLDAYNNYSTDLGAIENDFQDRKSSLEEAYAQDNLDSWQNSSDNVSGIFDKYKTAFENNQKQAYQDAYNTIANSTEKDESAILKYIEQFRNRLSDNDFLTLTQQATQVAQANKEAYEKEQTAKAEQSQRSAFEDARDAIESATYFTKDDFDKFLEQYRGQVTESQFNALKLRAEGKLHDNLKTKDESDRQNALEVVRDRLYQYDESGDYVGGLEYLERNKGVFGNNSQEYQTFYNEFSKTAEEQNKAKTEEEEKTKQEETDKRILEGKEFIKSNDGGQYQIKYQLDEYSNEIGHNRDFTNQLKEKFGTTNPYDSKIPNGTVLTIKCDSKGKNELNYEDFGLFDITDWGNWIPGYNIYNQITKWGNFNTRHVVYYNGNWYLADKK